MTTALALTAPAQIVLNVPPDPAPDLLTNAEVLNLLPGGRLGNEFLIGEDAVLNVQGGSVGNDLRALPASTVNIVAGNVGNNFHAEPNSSITINGGSLGDEAIVGGGLTITGGAIGTDLTITGGTTTIAGGRIGGRFSGRQGATVRMTGGIIDDVDSNTVHNFEMRGGSVGAFDSNNATFYGTDFRVDGRPIAGLDNIGDEVRFTMPERTLFTGVLADGTPFAFDLIFDDEIRGPVRLVREDPPPAPAVINIPGDPVPYGIRDGQTLNLHPRGVLPDHFTAGEGSILNVYGGRIGRNFEAFGATVNLYDGFIGDRIDSGDAFDGAVINIHGGRIDGGFAARSGATVNLIGGQIGGSFRAGSGSYFYMSGGSVVGGGASHGSTWDLRGGRVGATFGTGNSDDPILTIHGFNFQLDRESVAGLNEPGDETIIPRLHGTGTLFTGTLADGTRFAFRDAPGQRLSAPVRLVLTEPPAAPPVINVPSGSPPLSVGRRQTLNLRAGGALGENFVAGPGSVVNIEGGQVGDFFQAVNSDVNTRGGTVGGAFDAFAGAVVTISGGTFGPSFDAYPGSTIVIEGTHFTLDGTVLSDLDEPGESIVLTERGGRHLQATLADGSLFDLLLEPRPDVLIFGHDYVDPTATLRLVVAAPVIPEPSTLVLCCLMGVVIGIGSRRPFVAPDSPTR